MNVFNVSEEINEASIERSIDTFFYTLEDMFNKLGLLDDSLENFRESKFKFIEAFPDEVYTQNNVVTFHVCKRRPFSEGSAVTGGKKTTRVRPVLVKSDTYDLVSGNVQNAYAVTYENILELTCYAMSARVTKLLTRTLEAIFIKYLNILKKHVKEIIHLETDGIQLIIEYDQKRLFAQKMYFKVITEEYFKIDLEQLKNTTIDFNINK